jgi:hypothetical protein
MLFLIFNNPYCGLKLSANGHFLTLSKFANLSKEQLHAHISTTTATVTTKLRVEVVLILLILRVQKFPCLLPAVRRPTRGQSPPAHHYHGGRVLTDVDNNLQGAGNLLSLDVHTLSRK